MKGIRLGAPLLLWAMVVSAQDLKEFEKKVTEFTLANGLHFIVVERHDAPVVSLRTYVNAGSVNDSGGQTGLANLVARMAFQGTESIGTRDWAGEKRALDNLEEAEKRLEAERRKGSRAAVGSLTVLETQFNVAVERAHSFADPGEYRRIVAENGGVEVSARVQADAAEIAYNLPSNRIELWFLLESQRLLHPVFRDFYYERTAALEEHRANVETKSLARLEQTLLATAFETHPYRNPADGWPAETVYLGSSQAQVFFDKYYVPGNMVMAMAGDVDPAEVRRMAERYFGPMPAKPLPPQVHSEEPPQVGSKLVVVGAASQALMVMGYRRPDHNDRDDVVLDVVQLILAGGRAGWLYQGLQEKGIAQTAMAQATFPGGSYPNLFLLTVAPQPGHTLEENQKALDVVLARLQSNPVDADTLGRAKAAVRALAVQRLGNNADLAALMAAYYAGYGDWRRLFADLDRLNRVTAEDVQKAALRYFVPANRTVVYSPVPGRPDTVQGKPGGGQ